MWFWMFVGCQSADPDVARLEAELIELRARVEALEAQPGLDFDALVERANAMVGEFGGEGDALTPSEGISADLLVDIEGASKLGRFLLHRDADGEFDGYRVSAIRRGSALDRAGIHNGDVIHSVNGHGLASMTEAMGAYEAVQRDAPDALVVQLTRRGEAVTLTIPVLRSDAGAADPELEAEMDAAERERRRHELQERLRQRRAEREARGEPSP